MEIKCCKQCNREFTRKDGRSLSSWYKQKFCSNECRSISPKRTGVPVSEKTRLKLSIAGKGRPSHAWTKESREKARLAKLGRKHSETHRLNQIKSAKRGNLNHKWKGGVSKVDKIIRRMSEYFKWRSNVFERDNWSCQTCGFRGGYVTAHHIQSFASILREFNIMNQEEARVCVKLWDINNGVTLCENCHKLTDNYKGRGIIKNIT